LWKGLSKTQSIKEGRKVMVAKEKLEELRDAVLGTRGRAVQVTPEGEVIMNSGNAKDPESQQDQRPYEPKVSRMSPHTWGY
jgi:hypothetical protein